MTSKIDDISLALGGLRSDVANLTKAVAAAEQRNAESHKAMYTKLDVIDSRVREIEPDVRDIQEIKPKVEQLYGRQNWERGALFSLALGSGLFADYLRRKLGL